jgi:hypothetical protein
MAQATQTGVPLLLLIQTALSLKAELGLTAEQIERLSSLFYRVGTGHLLAQQSLANREADLARAIGSSSVNPSAVQDLVLEITNLRKDLEARTSAGLEALHAALAGEQFVKLLSAVDSETSREIETTSIKGTVDQYLAERIKDKDVVEIELASKIADRLYGWTKLFGFFVAIPIAVIIFGLGAFGITKVADLLNYANQSTAKLQKALDTANLGAKEVDEKLAELKKQTEIKLAALKSQNDALQSQVKNLEKCVYGNPVATGEASKSKLESKLTEFEKHMEKVGYRPDGSKVAVEIAGPGDASGAFAYYDPDKARIVLSQCAAGEVGMVFREFGHHVQIKGLSFDYFNKFNMVLAAIETGLVSYFACSYQNDPMLARAQTGSDGQKDVRSGRAMIDLENRKSLSSAGSIKENDYTAMYDIGDAWGGMFWDIRKSIGAELADQILFAAWHNLPPPDKNPSYATEMEKRILSQVRTKIGDEKEREIRELFVKRGLAV